MQLGVAPIVVEIRRATFGDQFAGPATPLSQPVPSQLPKNLSARSVRPPPRTSRSRCIRSKLAPHVAIASAGGPPSVRPRPSLKTRARACSACARETVIEVTRASALLAAALILKPAPAGLLISSIRLFWSDRNPLCSRPRALRAAALASRPAPLSANSAEREGSFDGFEPRREELVAEIIMGMDVAPAAVARVRAEQMLQRRSQRCQMPTVPPANSAAPSRPACRDPAAQRPGRPPLPHRWRRRLRRRLHRGRLGYARSRHAAGAAERQRARLGRRLFRRDLAALAAARPASAARRTRAAAAGATSMPTTISATSSSPRGSTRP